VNTFLDEKNHGAETFLDEKNHGAKTFLQPGKFPFPGPVSNKFSIFPYDDPSEARHL
jgi:hypothetical protein